LKALNRITQLAFCLLIAGFWMDMAEARQGMSAEQRMERARRLMAAPNPLKASDSVWIEELTYMEVRDRIAGGATTAIVSTGGIEENGPYLATGKHNYILEAICPAIAHGLGNALCAPIVPFVPEGDLDPPSEFLFFPGTFGVRDETFAALLDDIATSLKLHGFKDIVFIGDSGGNQRGMQEVTKVLNERWANTGVRAHFILEFYSPGWEDTEKYTEEVLGAAEKESDGHHDDMWVTAMMMVIDPETVRYEQRIDANLASINGFDISDLEKTVELGRKMVAFRATNAAAAIQKSIAAE
jgi:creatinine amidohydrolase/Fe(II)-dependent formamide hydrolase-like protein